MTNDNPEINETEVRFPAADGFGLSGRLLSPRCPVAAALISSATGFPKEFYLPFARFGAAQGFACLLYDYRGVGASAPDELKSFQVDFPDWGRLDMSAALGRLTAAAPDVPVVHIANSAGGHLIGFMPDHDKITSQIFLGVGYGTWWRHRFPVQPLRELFFWWIYGPLKLAMKGYIPAGGLWGGSTLPSGAFLTWRRWSHKRHYLFSDLDKKPYPNFFKDIKTPIISYVFADDPLTDVKTACDFLSFLPNAKSEVRLRRPADLGVKALGHQDLYRQTNKAAWPEIWAAAAERLCGNIPGQQPAGCRPERLLKILENETKKTVRNGLPLFDDKRPGLRSRV